MPGILTQGILLAGLPILLAAGKWLFSAFAPFTVAGQWRILTSLPLACLLVLLKAAGISTYPFNSFRTGYFSQNSMMFSAA